MDKKMYVVKKKILWAFAVSLLFLGNVKAQDTLSLTLDQAIEIALSENPTIKVAGQEIELRKTANKEAYAGLFPEVSLEGSYSRAIKKQTMAMTIEGQTQTIQVGTDNSYNGGITAVLPIYAPALYKTISLTKTDVDLAVEQARASKLDMINQVTKAYYQLLLAQDSHEVLEQSYANAEENYRIVNEKFRQGSVSEYDNITAEVQMRSWKPSVISAANAVTLAKLQLKVLMGMEPEIEIAAVGNLKDHEMVMFRRQLNSGPLSLESNSDMKQLNLNEKMLSQTLKLQRTNFLPTLALSFNYSYMSLNNDFKMAHYRWYPSSTLGLSLSIPLFKASNFTTTKQTKIQMSQLAETKINTERQLNMQVTSYLNNMEASTEQVISNREAITQAMKARDIAEKRYETGKGTLLELNSSETALTQAQLVYSQSIYDYLTAKADLDNVLGREDIDTAD